jgi:hypothetical protein
MARLHNPAVLVTMPRNAGGNPPVFGGSEKWQSCLAFSSELAQAFEWQIFKHLTWNAQVRRH